MRVQIWLFLLLILTGTQLVTAAPRKKPAAKPRFSPLQLKNKLVFTRGAPETVWTMNPDGTRQKQVWRAPKGYGRFGGFNSAGTQALSYNGYNLYLYDLKTSRRKQLFLFSDGPNTYIQSPSFSRDGKKIIFNAGHSIGVDVLSNVYIIDPVHPPRTVEAQRQRVVVPSQMRVEVFDPSLSGDGQKMVVSIGDRVNEGPNSHRGAWSIWTMGADGSAPVRVTFNPAAMMDLYDFDQLPRLNPDGQTIAFVRRNIHIDKTSSRGNWLGESNDVWLVDADGQNQRPLTPYNQFAAEAQASDFKPWYYNAIPSLSFSPDGKQIAFTQTEFTQTGLTQTGHKSGIYRVDVDGTHLQRLTDGTLVDWSW